MALVILLSRFYCTFSTVFCSCVFPSAIAFPAFSVAVANSTITRCTPATATTTFEASQAKRREQRKFVTLPGRSAPQIGGPGRQGPKALRRTAIDLLPMLPRPCEKSGLGGTLSLVENRCHLSRGIAGKGHPLRRGLEEGKQALISFGKCEV